MYRLIAVWLIVMLSAAHASAPVRAQDMVVPAELQAEIFKVALKFNRTIRDVSDVRVLIVHNDATDPRQVTNIVRAFGDQGYGVRAIHLDELRQQPQIDAEVLYVAPGVRSLMGISERHKILSITGMPHLVEGNLASIGTNSRNNRPGVVVNLISLRNESQEMQAAFLQSRAVQLIR